MKVPTYFCNRWEEYQSGKYALEAEKFARLSQMEVDSSRPPFLCAGDIAKRKSGKILTFGLAPHARKEYIPESLPRYYQWRVDYFNEDKVPHQIHAFFGRICYGILNGSTVEKLKSTWLHNNGYVTFDLVPYYIREWKHINWNNDLGLILKDHFAHCLRLIDKKSIRFAIFSGKAWENILVSKAIQLGEFSIEHDFKLSDITGKKHHKASIYVGKLNCDDYSFKTIVISHLIHQIWGLSHQNSFELGNYIRNLATKHEKA